jgi:hypothetical protein
MSSIWGVNVKRSRSLIVAATVVVGTTVGMTLPAMAADPVGGCPTAYELRTVVSLQEEATEAPPSFFTDADANGDGWLCNKYVPEAASFTGLAQDNKQKLK